MVDRSKLKISGATNGTFIHDKRLPANKPCPLLINGVFEAGDYVFMLQGRLAEKPTRQIWEHSYFVGRVQEECIRSKISQDAFTICHVEQLEPAIGDKLEQAFDKCLRPIDLLARYGPADYEMLADISKEQAREMLLPISIEFGDAVAIYFASYPENGKDATGLLDHLRTAIHIDEDPWEEVTQIEHHGDQMAELHALIEKVAPSDISIIIQGETGVGKEVISKKHL